MKPFILLPVAFFVGIFAVGYLYALLIAFISWSVEPLRVDWLVVRIVAAASLVFGWVFAAMAKMDIKEGGQ